MLTTCQLSFTKVTKAADQLYGLITLKWDFSLRLSFSISVIGKDYVKEEDDVLFLNQGSEIWCNDLVDKNTSYCEFEQFFREDLASSLSIEVNQVQILFIKSVGKDSVLVFFRFIPIPNDSPEHDALWINVRLNELIDQVSNSLKKIYSYITCPSAYIHVFYISKDK